MPLVSFNSSYHRTEAGGFSLVGTSKWGDGDGDGDRGGRFVDGKGRRLKSSDRRGFHIHICGKGLPVG